MTKWNYWLLQRARSYIKKRKKRGGGEAEVPHVPLSPWCIHLVFISAKKAYTAPFDSQC